MNRSQEDRWTARYQEAGADYLFGTTPNAYLARHAGLFDPGQTALSVADGEGRNSVWLAAQGLRVSAIEISAVAIEKARRLAAERGVTVAFQNGDILSDDWPARHDHEAYDWVVAVFIQFVGAEHRLRQFANLKRATRSGGRLLLQGYTVDQLMYRTGGPSTEENLYTEAQLRADFADWIIEALTVYEDTLHEGEGHKGPSALLGMVARKP